MFSMAWIMACWLHFFSMKLWKYNVMYFHLIHHYNYQYHQPASWRHNIIMKQPQTYLIQCMYIVYNKHDYKPDTTLYNWLQAQHNFIQLITTLYNQLQPKHNFIQGCHKVVRLSQGCHKVVTTLSFLYGVTARWVRREFEWTGNQPGGTNTW